jgi:ribosomal protein S11
MLLRIKARTNSNKNNNGRINSNKTQLPLNGKTLKSKFFFSKVITIRIKPNNVFCTFVNRANRKTISGTAAKYKVKMSKKALRYNYKLILKSFLKETKRFLKSKRVFISVTSPRKIRRELLRTLKTRLLRRKKFARKASGKTIRYSPDFLLFRFNSKKCFNGCRVRKKRRKKQRGLRIYK